MDNIDSPTSPRRGSRRSPWRFRATALSFGIVIGCLPVPCLAQQTFDPERGILIRGTVVTMDAAGSILTKGNVLVRSGKIDAVWRGVKPPAGTTVGDPVVIDLGPETTIFPGLINLHNHPTSDMLHLWPAPSSDVQAAFGRPVGTEPYANRYQWNRTLGTSPEYRRLVSSPTDLLTNSAGLGLFPEVGKYSEVKAILGGETAFEGGPANAATDDILIRNVDQQNFGRDHVEARVPPISALMGNNLDQLVSRMRQSLVDAWMVHLAEGVRDGQRRPGDAFSSRSEFAALVSKGLLTDMTVIVHGNGLEPADFAAMRAAPTIRLDGSGDGLGAKLVWSPLSNLLLYGQTALVYHALQAGVLVSLGTDWSPSGSRNLLGELKIADLALRDVRLLGADRELIPELGVAGKTVEEVEAAERALDELLVRMVTTNPARTLRWDHEVGTIEVGKIADLLVITAPTHPSAEDLPNSPYRNLIDATERDVRLVLVNGEPLAGDVPLMATLKPGDYEIVTSVAGGFQKAVDVTKPNVPRGTETLAAIEDLLRLALAAMGGDHPPAEGGPADDSNTYSYLKAHIPGADALTDAAFRDTLLARFERTPDGRLNLEAIRLTPLLMEEDDFYFRLLEAAVAGDTGLIDDTTPPFCLYPANFNHVQPLGNPLAADLYRTRYYDLIGMDPPAASPHRAQRAAEPGMGTNPRLSPSPLTATGFLAFTTPARGHVVVDLFDLNGRHVRTLLDDASLPPGAHHVSIDGRDGEGRELGSGVYLYRVVMPGQAWRGRLVIVR